MKRTLNLRLFACLLLALGVLATAVHFLHAYQVRRSARGLLEQAATAEDEERYADAANLLGRFLGYEPENAEVLARYALAFDKIKGSAQARLQAFLAMEQALRLDPSRNDVRRQLVGAAMDLERYTEAAEQLTILLAESPDQPELSELLGRCHEANKNFAEAEKVYERAIEHDQSRVSSYVARARVLRRMENSKKADAVMNNLVKNNPKSVPAHLARAWYRKELGMLALAEEDLAYARKELGAGEDADVLWGFAQVQLARAREHEAASDKARRYLEEARAYLQKGVELHPKNAAMYLALAELEAQGNNGKKAIDWLRRGLTELPDRTDLLWSLTELLTQFPESAEEAAGKIKQLRTSGLANPLVDYLEARLSFTNEQWSKAKQILETLPPMLEKLPDLMNKTEMLLGQCCEQLGDAERQYSAFRRVLSREPQSVAAARGMAAALLRLGKVDEALEAYRRLLGQTGEVQPALVRLLIQRSLSLPLSQRREALHEVDRIVADAGKADAVPVIVTMLQAEKLTALKEFKAARQLLTTARDKKPEEVAYWTALAALEEQAGDLKAVPPLLAEAERRLGDRIELRLAQASYWALQGEAEGRQAIRRLVEGADKLVPAEQARLWRGVAEAYRHLDDAAEAEKAWKRVADLRPNALDPRLKWFDVALQAGDETGMEAALQEIERVEGPDGALGSYGKICLLIKQQSLDEARRQVALLASRRPGWSRVAVAEARIDDLANNPDQAITEYQRAVDLGERDPAVIQRLAHLLRAKQRYLEADQIVRKLPEQALNSSDLQRFAAEASLRSREVARAAELARKAVMADSRNYREHIWLGQVLWASNQSPADVEAAFRKAVEIADQEPGAWVVLIQHLVLTNQKEKADSEIKKAKVKISADRVHLALAQCHQLMGQMDEARLEYEAALKTKPEDPATLRGAALYYLQAKQSREAELHLRKLKGLQGGSTEDADWARRMLAVLLVSRGDPKSSNEALELIGLRDTNPTIRAANERPEEVRLRAIILAAQKREHNRRDAVRLLEELNDRQPLLAEDQFLLGQLQEGLGEWRKARAMYLALAATHSDQAQHVAQSGLALLRHDDIEGAKVCLARLDKPSPDPRALVPTLELKARILHKEGNDKQAAELVENYSRTEDANLQVSAALLEEFGRTSAEGLYRKLAADSKSPEHVLLLAQYLGRHDQVGEALTLCERARSTCPPEKVSASSVVVLYAAKAVGEPCRRVGRWIEQESQKNPKSTAFLEHLAALSNLEERYQDAEAFYRRIIQLDDCNALAMNNLAWLIALGSGDKAEALKWINRAQELTGPEPSVLDTRAVIYLSLAQPSFALKDVKEAVAGRPTPSNYFHLARAYDALNDRTNAQTAWRKAKDLGLQQASLHPLERLTYTQLEARLESR